MATSTTVVGTYCRQEKHARIGGIAVDPTWRDWADLTAGPAGLIAERVLAGDVADYLRFRAVCRTWRRSSTSPHAHGSLDRRFHPRHWIMLPQTLGTVRKRRDFLNISTGERIQVDLPELCYQYVFGATSDGGLTVLCDKRTYLVCLLNPLTRQLTILPPASTLLYTASSQTRASGYTLQFLRVLGAGLADDSTVALHLDATWVVTAKPGDKQWTRLHIGYGDETIASSPFTGRFYCVTRKAIMVVDTTTTADHRAPQLAVAAELGDLGSMRLYDWTVKLVDNGGKLILVRRIPYDKNNMSWKGYEVHHVDLEARITIPMQQGLGRRALFAGTGKLGPGPALLLPAGLFPNIDADTVYWCNGYLAGSPRILAYSLLYGGARSCSVIEPCRLLNGCVRLQLDVSAIESVSRYVCASKIIRKQQRRSKRLALRRCRQRMCSLDHCNIGGQSQ